MPVKKSTPIFTYFRTEEDDQEFIGFKPANDAARRLVPEQKIVSKALARWDFDRAELKVIVAALPAEPEACLIPEELTLNAKALDMVQAIISEKQVQRGRDSVSFVISSYPGKLAIRYWREGAIDIVALSAEIDRTFRPGLTCITEYYQMEVDSQRFATAPAPLSADLATLEASFWNKVNPTFSDPYIRDLSEPYMADVGIEFLTGSERALRQAVDLLCYSWLAIRGHNPGSEITIYYNARTDEKPGGLWSDGVARTPGMTKELLRALETVGEENRFSGSGVHYNDDSRCRHSGYTRDSASIHLKIGWKQVSAHERIAYHAEKFDEAVAWLKARDFTDAEIAKIYLLPAGWSAKDGKTA